MNLYWLDVTHFLLRWLHVIAAIAWIGESIYFVMLDNSLRPSKDTAARDRGVTGEMWAVHGGGFYHHQKYAPQMERLPDSLHWSFWKSYVTWLSGFALFSLLYLANAEFFLLNPGSAWEWAAHLSSMQAGALAVGILLGSWWVYDELCKRISPNLEREALLSFAVALLMLAIAYLTTQIFSGRAAFLLTGSVMATFMTANVFFWIIPGQRRMVAALQRGDAPNPLDGKRGKQRSVHNTYFTLPVVLLMISNHATYFTNHTHAWILMGLLILAGALIRQFFVVLHTDRVQPLYLVVGALLVIGAFWITKPPPPPPQTSGTASLPGQPQAQPPEGQDGFAEIQQIVEQHCRVCHAQAPTYPGFLAPPAGIVYDEPAQIRAQYRKIQQVVASGYMPLGNVTRMQAAERARIAAWHPDQNHTQP